jgi:hypothetical protein
MLRLLLVFGLLAPQEENLRGVVRRLGDDDATARDRAGLALEKRGMASLDALEEALKDPDLEIRSRAAILVDRIDPSYFLASRIHAQRKRKLRANPGLVPHEEAKASTEGAEFGFQRSRWIEGGKTLGTLIRTRPMPHLDGEITWSVASIRSNRELQVETCSTHSPRIVLIADDIPGPCTVTLKGVRRWLCDIPVRFNAPKEGDCKRIGRFTLTLEWPQVTLRCDDPLPPSLVTLMLQSGDIHHRLPGPPPIDSAEIAQPSDEPAIFFPEAREEGERAKTAWCGCPLRPARSELPPATSQKRWIRIDTDDIRELRELAELSLTLHVPVEEPFEVTSPPLEP